MDSPLANIAIDLGEVALDSSIQDGVLQDIPILGTAINLARAVSSVRDRLLLRKIQSFLLPCAQLTSEERAKFRKRMEDEQNFRDKVEEILVLYLDRCDALRKAQIYGAIFMGLARETIDIQVFNRLIYCVDHSFTDDLDTLGQYPKVGKPGFRNARMKAIALPDLMRQTNVIECHISPEGSTLLRLMEEAKIV